MERKLPSPNNLLGGQNSWGSPAPLGKILWSYCCSLCSLLQTGSTLGVWISPYIDITQLLMLITIEFTDYNGAIFNIRARALNNVVYWLAQIVGSILVGLVLDSKRLRRRIRAFTGWGILFALIWVVHIWGYFYQRWVQVEPERNVTNSIAVQAIYPRVT